MRDYDLFLEIKNSHIHHDCTDGNYAVYREQLNAFKPVNCVHDEEYY